jgi:uncharacterized OsmC-like protein
MAVEITGRYIGNLAMEMTHGPSGAVLKTVPPVDNQGDGSSFSPTDLVATALAACMVSLIAIVGERDELDLTGLSVHVEKHMAGSPRRIGRLPSRIRMPAGLTPAQRKKLENAALTCPVHMSLHPDIEREVEFEYPD